MGSENINCKLKAVNASNHAGYYAEVYINGSQSPLHDYSDMVCEDADTAIQYASQRLKAIWPEALIEQL